MSPLQDYKEERATEEVTILTVGEKTGSKTSCKRGYNYFTLRHVCITYIDKVTNDEIKGKVTHSIGPHESLLATVQQKNLKRYEQLLSVKQWQRPSIQGTVRGGRR